MQNYQIFNCAGRFLFTKTNFCFAFDLAMSQSPLIVIQTHKCVSISHTLWASWVTQINSQKKWVWVWEKVQGESCRLLEDQLEGLMLRLISRLTIKTERDSNAQTYYHRYVCPMCAMGQLSLHNCSTLTTQANTASHCLSKWWHPIRQQYKHTCTCCVSRNIKITHSVCWHKHKCLFFSFSDMHICTHTRSRARSPSNLSVLRKGTVAIYEPINNFLCVQQRKILPAVVKCGSWAGEPAWQRLCLLAQSEPVN